MPKLLWRGVDTEPRKAERGLRTLNRQGFRSEGFFDKPRLACHQPLQIGERRIREAVKGHFHAQGVITLVGRNIAALRLVVKTTLGKSGSTKPVCLP